MNDLGLISLMVLSIGLPVLFVLLGLIGRKDFASSWLGQIYNHTISIPEFDGKVSSGPSLLNYLFGGLSRKAIIVGSVGSVLSIVYLATGLLGVVPFYGVFAVIAIFLTMAVITPMLLSVITNNPIVVSYFDKLRPEKRRLMLGGFLAFDGIENTINHNAGKYVNKVIKISVYVFCFTEAYYFYFWIINLFPDFPIFTPSLYLTYVVSIIIYLQNGGHYKIILTDAIQILLICICILLGYVIFINFSLSDLVTAAENYALPGLFREEDVGWKEYFMTISCIVGLVVIYGCWYIASHDMWVRIGHLILRNREWTGKTDRSRRNTRLTYVVMSALLILILGLVTLVGIAGAEKFDRSRFDHRPDTVANFLDQQAAYTEIGISIFEQLIYPPTAASVAGQSYGGEERERGPISAMPLTDITEHWPNQTTTIGTLIGVLAFCVLCMCAMTSLDTAIMSLSQIDYDYIANVIQQRGTIREIDVYNSVGRNCTLILIVLGPLSFHILADLSVYIFKLNEYGITVSHLFAAIMITAGYSVFIISVNLAMLVVLKLYSKVIHKLVLDYIRPFLTWLFLLDGLLLGTMYCLYLFNVSFEPIIHRNMLMNIGTMSIALILIFIGLCLALWLYDGSSVASEEATSE